MSRKITNFTKLLLNDHDYPDEPKPENTLVETSVDTHEKTSKNTPVNTPELTSVSTTDLAHIVTIEEAPIIATNIEPEVTVVVETNTTHEVAPNKKRKWKPRPDSFEANYAKKTMWIRKDLLELLNDASVYKGDITNLLNEGLEIVLKKRNKKLTKESGE